MKHQEHNHFSFLELLPRILMGRVGVSFVCTSSRAIAASLLLASLPAWGGGVVTNCTEADLRAAMAGGGTVTFACDGTITLVGGITITNVGETRLDSSGHSVTITATQAFYVPSNSTFTVIGLTIANCSGSSYATSGAGIYNDGGIVNLASVVFQGNSVGYPGYGYPGVTDPKGGAIYNHGGQLNATNCTFDGNQACRLSPWKGWSSSAWGGAIYNEGGAMNLQQCVFTGNSLWGPGGGPGSTAGGAVYSTGSLVADACAFVGNNSSGGYPAGRASGGAIYNSGALTVSRSLFAGNSVYAGPGDTGGPGGDGRGSAVSSSGSGVLVNCTFTTNSASGGDGGAGGNGGGAFGAIYDGNGSLSLINCSIVSNSAHGGVGGTNGSAVGGVLTSGSRLVNLLLAGNSSGNCLGWIADAGHNLSSDGTCNFTSTGSMNSTDPKVGPLANNGGPTLTITLLPGSPAIDAGDTAAAPMTDQRGFPRPAGSAADIGAFEFGSMMPVLNIARSGPGVFDVLVKGNSNQWCRLLASSNLSSWAPIATNQIGPDGSFHFSCDGSARRSFYRVVMP